MRILGIDPGLSGALAVLGPTGSLEHCFDVPLVPARTKGNEVNWALLAEQLEEIHFATKLDHAVIERVSAMPKQGVTGVFNFGYAAGGLRGLVASLQLRTTMVAPATWKKAMGLSSDKDRSRFMACQLFPKQAALFARKKDNNRAEAALIAYYGRTLLLKGATE